MPVVVYIVKFVVLPEAIDAYLLLFVQGLPCLGPLVGVLGQSRRPDFVWAREAGGPGHSSKQVSVWDETLLVSLDELFLG